MISTISTSLVDLSRSRYARAMGRGGVDGMERTVTCFPFSGTLASVCKYSTINKNEIWEDYLLFKSSTLALFIPSICKLLKIIYILYAFLLAPLQFFLKTNVLLIVPT